MSSPDDILDSAVVKIPKKNEISISFSIICIVIALLGIVFQIQHWPFSAELLFLGCGVLCGYLSAKTVFIQGRNKIILITLIPLCISCLLIIRYQNFLNAIYSYVGITLISFIVTLVLGLRIKRYNRSIEEE